MSTKSTTIRISKETKERIENLDFVRKDTFDGILIKLIEFYEKKKAKKGKK
jgi:predicted DNA-binding protein